jgi:hypothetical protein
LIRWGTARVPWKKNWCVERGAQTLDDIEPVHVRQHETAAHHDRASTTTNTEGTRR